jgi:transcriptional regulator with XRE-family HTH domain
VAQEVAQGVAKEPVAGAKEPPLSPNASEAVPLPEALAAVSPDKLANALQAHLLAAIHLMQRFIQACPVAERTKWERQLPKLQTTLRMVHKSCPSEALPPESASSEGALDPERVKEFGELVASARKTARLARRDLARRSGLSEKTIWNVENGGNMPTHATVLRLLSIKELGLSSEQVPWQHKGTFDFGSAPNCWIAPGYEPLKLFTELFEVLNGPGGTLEQTFVYLDHQSAVNWYELSNQSFYAAKYRARIPLDVMARRILEHSGHGRLDVIALGSGDGKQETRLVEHLLDWADESRRAADLRLYLLDVSQPLLSAAYQHAAQTVGARRGVLVQAIQGNFHHWPRYTQLHHTAERGHRRRLVSMLGYTIGNLDNEASFFQHTLVGLAPDDLLLLDLLNAAADPQHPDEVIRKDSAFSSGPTPEHRKWLVGPLMRYCQGLQSIDLKYALGAPCTVPGSYAIEVIADIELRDRRHRRFALHRFKRYDPKRLAEMMQHLGWALLGNSSYGPDEANPLGSLLLFRKLSP